MLSHSIGIIGGTGPQGRGLAMRLALARQRVRIGSRQADRAQTSAKELNGLLDASVLGLEKDKSFHWIEGDSNAEVTRQSNIVMLTVPFENAAGTLRELVPHLQPGTIFVDVTVPLEFGKGDVMHMTLPEGSGSKHLRTILPEQFPLVGACKTQPAGILEQIDTPLGCCDFVFADNKAAKETVMEILEIIPHLKPLDVGGLSAAATVEGMTALLIRINRRHKVHSARFDVTGLHS
jgi:8-hydroxy-5-deazaflavin:NADPH oxidoreductase